MRHAPTLRKLFCLLLLAAIGLPVAALDLDRAKDVYGPCAACHGPFGAGGKQGEYPRIAGQSPKYVEQQLQAFQSQSRLNLPMYPYTRERELDAEDMKLLAAYLAQIELPTRPPVFKDSDDALARLLAMEKVMIIPRAAGNIENGQAVYQKKCAVCHGKRGQGRGMFPMLVGQYTNYLQKQIDAYLQADRPHDEDGSKTGALYRLKSGDIQDVLAYLTTLQAAEQ
jgi:cytochrome c553